jgi:hypothetical protein
VVSTTYLAPDALRICSYLFKYGSGYFKPNSLYNIGPLIRAVELSREHWCKVLVIEASFIVLGQEVNVLFFFTGPYCIPIIELFITQVLSLMVLIKTDQNHSLPNDGTEKTPQCINMPILASSYHVGSGRLSTESHVGSNRTLVAFGALNAWLTKSDTKVIKHNLKLIVDFCYAIQ